MMLYEPERKSDSLSTRTTSTSMSTMPRYVLYDPADQYLPQSQRPHKPAPHVGRHVHHTHNIEVRENGAVVTNTTTMSVTSPYYYGKHSLLEDPYDAQGIRQGAWEIGPCNPRACLPMTLCVPFALPSIAIAQMRARLGLAHYGSALVREFLQLLAVGALPIATYVALVKLQRAPELAPGAPISEQAESTAWMVLLWISVLAVVIILLVTSLVLSDLRFKIRARFQIPGTRGRDFCVVVCLPTCAVAQMSTHVRCLRPGRYSLERPETLPPYEY